MSAGYESWKAQEKTDLVGSDRKITVTGTVQTSNSSQEPELVEGNPGLNETILLLDLKITGGIGGTVMGAREVRFEKPVEPNQYSQVTIRREGGKDVTIDVEVVHS
jgi:hypothetical protein